MVVNVINLRSDLRTAGTYGTVRTVRTGTTVPAACAQPGTTGTMYTLLPHFWRVTKQHTASFDYFVEIEIKKVVAAVRCCVN